MFLFPMPIAPHSLPPNPSLVAIILIVTTRRGPRSVFHYPGTPEPSQPSNSWAFGSLGSDSEDSSDSSDDEGTTTSDAEDTGSRAGSVTSTNAGQSKHGSHSGRTGKWSVASASTRRTTRTLREDGPEDEEDVDDDIQALDSGTTENNNTGTKESKLADDAPGSGNKNRSPEWEKVLGYPTEALEKLLSPPDNFKKKKFEVSIEDLVFLGYPVFARKDGAWKKKKRKGKKTKDDSESDEDAHGPLGAPNPFAHAGQPTSEDLSLQALRAASLDSPELSPTTTHDDIRRPNMMNHLAPPPDPNPPSQSFGSTYGMSEAASEDVSTTSGGQDGDNMSMFHVVFVMNPPTLEYHIRVQEMYDNVVKKFSKALRYEQAQSGWVEKEAKTILTMKNQAKESSRPVLITMLEFSC